MLRQIVKKSYEQKLQDLNVEDDKFRFMSMGAGVQTTALLLAGWKRYLHGGVIFSDTGAEQPETYQYIEDYLYPFCLSKGLSWITGRMYRGGKTKRFYGLPEFCRERRIIPIIQRRWCTHEFKINPLHRVLKQCGATPSHVAISDVGISADEAHRLRNNEDNPKYVRSEYPLAWNGITREECKRIITEAGFPIPPKSGCTFCPFQKKTQLMRLMHDQPVKFQEAMELEKNNAHFPRDTIMHKGTLEGMYNGGSNLDAYFSKEEVDRMYEDRQVGQCDSGHCFV